MIDKDTEINTKCYVKSSMDYLLNSNKTIHLSIIDTYLDFVVAYSEPCNMEDEFIGIIIKNSLNHWKGQFQFCREDFVTLKEYHFPLADSDISNDKFPECNHEYVNVSFNQIKMACKYCGKDK